MSPLPKLTQTKAKIKAPLIEPAGFNRAKAVKIVEEGPAKAPVFKVYSVNGTLLGAASTHAGAEGLRDRFPLEKLFL